MHPDSERTKRERELGVLARGYLRWEEKNIFNFIWNIENKFRTFAVRLETKKRKSDSAGNKKKESIESVFFHESYEMRIE